MSRFEIVDHTPSYLFEKTSILSPTTKTLMLNPYFPSCPIVEDELDLLSFNPSPPISEFDTITDLIQIHETPFYTSTRVSALELGFDTLVREEKKKEKIGERKYSWTAEIKTPEKDRKYKWTTEIKADEKKEVEKSYKWTSEIKGRDGEYSPNEQTYIVKVSNGGETEGKKKKKKCEDGKLKCKSMGNNDRVVEIEEPCDHGAIVLRKVFAKRLERKRGKRKELSLQDAAALIQMSFRAYLIRRSQALGALRELAITKNKLKESSSFP